MGKTIKPKYCVIIRANFGTVKPYAAWSVKDYGRVTQKNVDAWRDTLNASFQTGGVNAHLTSTYGYVPHVSYAAVCLNNARFVPIVESNAPMFEIV